MREPIRPNRGSIIPIILGFAAIGDYVTVDKLIAQLKKKRIHPTREYFNDLLYALVKGKLQDRVDKTLIKMRRAGFEPDIKAFNNILGALAEIGDTVRINSYLENTLRFKQFDMGEYVPTTPGQFLSPTAETYHLILKGYVANNLHHFAVEIFRMMRDRKVQPLPESVPLIEEILQKTKSNLPLDVFQNADRGDLNYIWAYKNQ